MVIGDETWVHHCDPENKRQSVEYCHEGSLAQNKFCCKSQVDCILELWRCCAHWLPGKGVAVNWEHYTENLKNLKNASWGRGQKWMMSCFGKTSSISVLHVWGLWCYHIQSTACIFLLAISTCSPDQRKTSGAKFSVLLKKSRPLVVGERKRLF